MTDKREKNPQEEGIELAPQNKNSPNDQEDDYITVPPDGGFGWIVLIACFVSSHKDFLSITNVMLYLDVDDQFNC